ncbi:MAG: hypothetical protein KAU24_01765 [Candidatus Aenigmarchaeota archaeon]|nr:hypothetical protein [Candidatus Aenigmarchaeota archaeon]
MRQKSQAATEFLILFIILMIALSVALYMSVERTRSLMDTEIGLESMKVLNDASNKINIAFLEGHGFLINLTLPGHIFGMNYSINIQSNYMVLEVYNTTYLKSLLTDNVTGSLEKGINLIENRNGVIVIS